MKLNIFAAICAALPVLIHSHFVRAEDESILRLGGSTTLLPVISKVASDYMEKFKTWNNVDSNFPKKDIVIFVSGGGSSFGVKSAINGTVNIGLASRNLKDKEKKLLGKYQTYLVGRDAVVIATNAKSPLVSVLDNLSSGQVASIFSAEAKTLKHIEASLPANEIVLLVRDSGAGSAEMMQDLIMKDKQISPNALQLPSQGALLRKLEINEHAVGYISSGLVLSNDSVTAFGLNGVAPTNENVVNGSYGFSRPLLMVVKGKPGGMTQKFIDYVLNEGQNAVAANNYVPAGSFQ